MVNLILGFLGSCDASETVQFSLFICFLGRVTTVQFSQFFYRKSGVTTTVQFSSVQSANQLWPAPPVTTVQSVQFNQFFDRKPGMTPTVQFSSVSRSGRCVVATLAPAQDSKRSRTDPEQQIVQIQIPGEPTPRVAGGFRACLLPRAAPEPHVAHALPALHAELVQEGLHAHL